MHPARRAVKAQPELAAERLGLDAGEDVLVHDAGALAGRGKDAETDADRIRAQRMQERPGEDGDDCDHHRQRHDRGHAATHAVRPARYRQPAPTSSSPAARAA